jgi:hypothetical protein
MNKWRTIVPVLGIALPALAGVFMRYSYYVGDATGAALHDASFNYFSFFTIESNLLVAGVATSFAIGAASGRMSLLARPPVASAACLYVSIAGIVYYFILSPLEDLSGGSRLSTEIMHYYVPVVYFLFWLAFIQKGTLSFRGVLGWLVFPAGYGLYTIARGAVVSFYPYPFVNVANLGYPTVIANVAYFVVGFGLAGMVLLGIDWLLGRRHASTH